jgi:hypothetical protein
MGDVFSQSRASLLVEGFENTATAQELGTALRPLFVWLVVEFLADY